jgi:hypothetical protein
MSMNDVCVKFPTVQISNIWQYWNIILKVAAFTIFNKYNTAYRCYCLYVYIKCSFVRLMSHFDEIS